VEVSSDPFVITSAAISKMNVQFFLNAPSGQYYLDDVSAIVTPAVLANSIDLPAAPSVDLRGN
jgi:hypothetical protein